jgi:hypothetical protein
MKIDKTTGISIGALLVIIPLLAGAVVWYEDHRDDAVSDGDNAVQAQSFAGDVELSLQAIELELKMFRVIAERRELTADEEDRKSYLEALREIIVAEQRKKVA